MNANALCTHYSIKTKKKQSIPYTHKMIAQEDDIKMKISKSKVLTR